MALEYIIYTLYLIPILLNLQSYQATAREYDRLPDQLPMKYDFQGKVIRWWPKNKFSAYLMPHIGMLMNVFMGIILYVIHSGTGPLPDDYALAFWFFDFSLVYLFYKTQAVTLTVTQDVPTTPWQTMKTSFALVIISSVILVSLIFINNEPVIGQADFSAEINNKEPVDIRDHFTAQDKKVYLVLKLQNVKGEQHVVTKWFTPRDELYFEYRHKTHHKVLAKRQILWSYINVNKNKPTTPGEWRADVYVNDEKKLTKYFTISAY